TVQFVLPELALNMDRIFPFKRKFKVGKDKWYEKVGLTYSTNLRNQLNGRQDDIFTNESVDKMTSGMKHNFGLNTSYKLLKVMSWQPFINYTEQWDFKRLDKSWSDADTMVITDTLKQFGRYGRMNTGMNFSTKIYGNYQYRSGPIKAIRHIMTPAIGFTYTPDYSSSPYLKEVRTPNDSLVETYSMYNSAVNPYGTAPMGKETGSISFNLRNSLEMKIANKKDTVKGEKKVKLLDQLNFGTNYNMFADSLNWSTMRIVANTNLFNVFQINYNSVLDFYVAENITINETESRRRVNKFELNENGKLGRFVNHRMGINFSLGNKKQQDRKKDDLKKMNKSSMVYQNIPWTMTFGYTFNLQRPTSRDTSIITQSLQVSTVINLTKNWKFEGTTNYDFQNNDFGYTRFSLYRDMNCWEAKITVVPKGGQQNYSFSINIKPAMLKDLKLERKRNYYDFN
ncbi:MAG: putative LPS assembly protein LptD, partial [Flavobacteriales bacterium]